MITFENVTELEAWLTANGIDTSCWGTGGAKTVENLWSELAEGESELHADPPRRQVRIVSVTICRGRRTLVEVGQAFGENQYRYRDMPPTEKMKPGEQPVEAAVRCLQEELEADPNRVKILSAAAEPEQTMQDSQSYPGLTTYYVRYYVEAKVAGLPRQSFSTMEAAHDDGDPVKSHQWRWKPLAAES
ncbi:MAG: NUDIX domain-containing protein [Anaerolineales bacterium]|nr:NUDIX domain-containing protein [Anaerolineales bacterium]